MADPSQHSSEDSPDLSSLESGNQLDGGLLSPATGGRSDDASAAEETGLDAELAEIMASIETVEAVDSVEPIGGTSSVLEISDEPAGDVDLLDSEGVLTIDLPDEIPPPTDLDASSGGSSGPGARQSRPADIGRPDSPHAAGSGPGASEAVADAAKSGEEAAGEDDQPGIGRRRRRRRNPFENMEKASSARAGMAPKDLMTLSDLKRIKRARVRHDGQRVITDDVKKLKSLTIEPHLPPGEYVNYYVEPVRIEYYIPKESRFAVETRFLYINLIDPEPRPGPDDVVLKQHIEQNRFVDIVDIMNEHPMHITDILESYNTTMGLYESLSRAIQEADEGEDEAYRKAFYLCEVLMDYEPTMASLNFLGDFLAWNINWLIRAMNSLGLEFAAADKTISYLIKQRNAFWEEHDLAYDERFETLAALFFEQAFPNRGLEEVEEDYFYDIFDKKFTV